MSVTRVKTIFENLSNRNISNQKIKELVVDYLSDSATGQGIDTENLSNDELAQMFLVSLRQHIKGRVCLSYTSNRFIITSGV